jgi:hypothetical protein
MILVWSWFRSSLDGPACDNEENFLNHWAEASNRRAGRRFSRCSIQIRTDAVAAVAGRKIPSELASS